MSQTIIIGANDPNIAYLLKRYSEESGFETSHVSRSGDVLAMAFHLEPTLIILDIELVETTDWEVVRRLKAEPAICHVPVVIYSCLGEPPEDWQEGVDGYLLKSVMYADFVAVLERARAAHKEESIG
ncbi:MAG: hypothetical protein HY868_11085 [Chloroflexi bacterium]|nr:hypothetical protein [Chloroflexota bacterium]